MFFCEQIELRVGPKWIIKSAKLKYKLSPSFLLPRWFLDIVDNAGYSIQELCKQAQSRKSNQKRLLEMQQMLEHSLMVLIPGEYLVLLVCLLQMMDVFSILQQNLCCIIIYYKRNVKVAILIWLKSPFLLETLGRYCMVHLSQKEEDQFVQNPHHCLCMKNSLTKKNCHYSHHYQPK